MTRNRLAAALAAGLVLSITSLAAAALHFTCSNPWADVVDPDDGATFQLNQQINNLSAHSLTAKRIAGSGTYFVIRGRIENTCDNACKIYGFAEGWRLAIGQQMGIGTDGLNVDSVLSRTGNYSTVAHTDFRGITEEIPPSEVANHTHSFTVN